ncbi:MAG: AAA family ATPase, partial [Candidatus Cloacimonetes bacterium]|nr:AAA family ATPase [Candidatus Cloacimonadota bacterium]
MQTYQVRTVDLELDELLPALSAIALEGPRAVGKTATAARRAGTIHRLDDPAQAAIAEADPARLLAGGTAILLDEWQRVPAVWDAVRHSVDQGAAAGSFLLTGSAGPGTLPTHSGAGRIVSLRMRPM